MKTICKASYLLMLSIVFLMTVHHASRAQAKDKQEQVLALQHSTSCIPDTAIRRSLELEDQKRRARGILAEDMTELEFNRVISEVADVYRPIITSFGGHLVVNALWEDSTINASAERVGNNWIVNMFGGLARQPAITSDGFAAVVCHELGHHLAGYPYYPNSEWLSTEGQSDYFATHACLRKTWAGQYEKNAQAAAVVDPFAKEKCDLAHTDQESRNLCYRIAGASQSLSNLLAGLGGQDDPKFSTPDPTVVSATLALHTSSQCRLDTFIAGFLCPKTFSESSIPGDTHPLGHNSIEAEIVSSRYLCLENQPDYPTSRPSCWFKLKGRHGPKALVNDDIFAAVRGQNPDGSLQLIFSIHKSSQVSKVKVCQSPVADCLWEEALTIESLDLRSENYDRFIFRNFPRTAFLPGNDQNIVVMVYTEEFHTVKYYRHLKWERN